MHAIKLPVASRLASIQVSDQFNFVAVIEPGSPLCVYAVAGDLLLKNFSVEGACHALFHHNALDEIYELFVVTSDAVKCLNASSGAELFSIAISDATIAEVSRSREYLYVATGAGTIRRYLLTSHQPVEVDAVQAGGQSLVQLSVSPLSSDILICYTDDRRYFVVNFEQGAAAEFPPPGDQDSWAINAIRFHPTLPVMAILHNDSDVVLIDSEQQRVCILLLNPDEPALAIDFSPVSPILWVSGAGGIQRVDISKFIKGQDELPVTQMLRPSRAGALYRCVRETPDGRLIAGVT